MTLSKASATSIWQCRISMTRGFLPFTPSASASCAITPSKAACCSTWNCSPIPRRFLRKRREDFWRQHFYSGSALLPRLAMAHGRSPTTGLSCSGKHSTIQTWSLSLPPEPKPAAEIGKEIETKLAEMAEEWSKSAAAVTRILSNNPSLSRDKSKSNSRPTKSPRSKPTCRRSAPIFGMPTPESLGAITLRIEIRDRAMHRNPQGPRRGILSSISAKIFAS